jgi:hypothetical protein
VDLVHDLLDQQVFDKQEKPIGRVDGIVLTLRDGAPPRVREVRIGGTVLARRLHPRLARWAAWLRGRWGTRDATPTALAVKSLRRRGLGWATDDVDARDTPALAWELWLRTHVVARLPGRGT